MFEAVVMVMSLVRKTQAKFFAAMPAFSPGLGQQVRTFDKGQAES